MQTYICKCGKTFKKLSKAETTGYVLNDYSPRHECYGCPYIVSERSWQTNEIIKRECRATPKITYLSKCHIGTGKGDFTACKVYSLDLTFVKRVMSYVNSLDGAETGDHLNRIPGEWRAADFGICYSTDNCFGLAIFNLYFKNNKAGTAARRLVKERFFSESGVRKDMTEEKERETVLMRIQIAKENARIAFRKNNREPTKNDIALVEMYRALYGTYFDVFLEHYPNFDASRFDEFAEDICAAECFDDVNGCLGGTAGKHDTACKISCKECWKNECALQWKLTEDTEKYIEPYLTVKKEEDKMARKLQIDAAITKDMKSAASDSFIDNIKMIDVDDIWENDDNFYSVSDIELLADDIEREGLMHNLVVSKSGSKYVLKSGHRRLAAIKLLIKEKRLKSTKIPCYVSGEKTEAETQFDLIMLNATQRKYSDADVMREYEEIERTFKALEAEGKPLKGRIRDNIAAVLKVSPAQVGKIENIKHNAVSEVEKAVKSGAMSISTANEVAKLSEEKQREIADKSPDISHKEVKKLLENEKPPVQKITKPLEEVVSKPDELDDDFDELDELLDDDDDELGEESEVKSENKSSSKTFTLTLSEADASSLLDFLNEWADDNDDDAVVDVWNKLKAFLG